MIADELRNLVDAEHVTVVQTDSDEWTVTVKDDLVVLSQAELAGLVSVLERQAGGRWAYVVTVHRGVLSVTLTEV